MVDSFFRENPCVIAVVFRSKKGILISNGFIVDIVEMQEIMT